VELSGKVNYLPRLHASAYRADAVVLWTLTTFDRKKGWVGERFHRDFRELLWHSMAREELVCPVYVLMPDHIHLVWMGLAPESDQRNGMAFLRTHLEPLILPARFQPQAHDHVLTRQERMRNAFARLCEYVRLNPVRAGLVRSAEDWVYSGCLVPRYPTLRVGEADFWPNFWKIYRKLREPECEEHVVVPGTGELG
jgi:putative transposase